MAVVKLPNGAMWNEDIVSVKEQLPLAFSYFCSFFKNGVTVTKDQNMDTIIKPGWFEDMIKGVHTIVFFQNVNINQYQAQNTSKSYDFNYSTKITSTKGSESFTFIYSAGSLTQIKYTGDE